MPSWNSRENVERDSGTQGSQNTLRATQELLATQELVTNDNQNVKRVPRPNSTSTKVWGTLIPVIENLDVVELRGNSFRVGRDPQQCHVLLTPHHLPDEDHQPDEYELDIHENMDISCVSREHLCIVRERDIVVVEDLSINGTFVNGIQVGFKNKQMLRDGDTIGILGESFVLYIFISEEGPRKTFPAPLCDLYHMGSLAGAGVTSHVYEAWKKEDYLKVAVKVINKIKWPTKYSQPDDLLKEVTILKNLEHPGITKVLDVIETPRFINIVMEFAEGGELIDSMINEDSGRLEMLDERDAKFQFYQICITIDYLHSKDVCHRDLKLENLLLVSPNPKSQVKVSDFGLAKVSNGASVLESYVGTPLYMAPEVISSAETGDSYNLKSDCWSLGVILFTLLSGTRPFRSQQSERSLHRQILCGNFAKMEGSVWDQVTDDAKNLVSCLLVVDPRKRFNTSQILHHKWFISDKQLCEEARKVLFKTEIATDSGRGRSTRKVVTNLEVLDNKEKTPAKKRPLSFNEGDQKRDCPRKRMRTETKGTQSRLNQAQN